LNGRLPQFFRWAESLDVAIENWQYLFEQGRFSEARAYWWSTVEPLRT
jgi:hypothetical protein